MTPVGGCSNVLTTYLYFTTVIKRKLDHKLTTEKSNDN
jgi:hypothetical protein